MSDRNSWATPAWLTALLPYVDLDPCSNSHSTVRARQTYSLEAGQDGLALPWFGTVYVNGPYANLMPWAMKLAGCYSGIDYGEHRQAAGVVFSAGFLVNVDSSTAWWRALCAVLPLRFDFHKRIQFVPPDGVTASTNSKPQALVCDWEFWARCSPDLAQHGTLWTQHPLRRDAEIQGEAV